jgi:hypothetical protein
MQNYPNPFNPGTSIRFKTTVKGLGSLSVFDISGKVVARLLENQEIAEGVHSVSFEASDLASGMYFYKLEFTPLMENSPIVLSKRMAFIK